MHNFSHEPPIDTRGNSLQLKRCPTGRELTGIITCSDMVGTATHFYHGRTLPCDSDNCAACSDGMPWRWHAYVSLWGPKVKQHILFEMTARACEPLKAYREANGTLRGCVLIAKRVNSSPNARVLIHTSVADLELNPIPAEPNLLSALSILWNIELPAIALDGRVKDTPAAKVTHNPALHRFEPEDYRPLKVGKNGEE